MKATTDPVFDINGDSNMYASGVNTRRLFLECLQHPHQAEQGLASAKSAESECKTSSKSSFEKLSHCDRECSEKDERCEVKESQQVFFKGRWYSEEEVVRLEVIAMELDSQIKSIEDGNIQKLSGTVNQQSNLGSKSRPNDDPSAVLNDEGIICAIFVVEGGTLMTHSKAIGSSTWKEVTVKISTGGILTWGNKTSKQGRVLWVRSISELYNPTMSKSQFEFMNRKFEVMLEAGGNEKPVCAFSIDGGTVQAASCKNAIEFVAKDEDERNRWVLGITCVLDMTQKSAQERLSRKQTLVRVLSRGLYYAIDISNDPCYCRKCVQ